MNKLSIIFATLALVASCISPEVESREDALQGCPAEFWEVGLDSKDESLGCPPFPRLELVVVDPCVNPYIKGDDDGFWQCGAQTGYVKCEHKVTEELVLLLYVAETWGEYVAGTCLYEFR